MNENWQREIVKRDNIYLSVIFSFRNEEEALPELIDRIRQAMTIEIEKGVLCGYELIFVNDDSRDRSIEVLEEKAKAKTDIRVINMSRRFGVSPCVLAGMEYSKGDVVIYMDADLQDPPELISDLLKAFTTNEVDIVHTVRQKRQGESVPKLWITRIGYIILHKLTTIRLPVEAGDFKLLSRRAVNHIVRLREKRPFMRGLVCWIGFKQISVPYDRCERKYGKTKFPVLSLDVINNFFESALISFSAFPLRFASFIGFLSILVSLGLLVHVLLEKIQGHAIPGWTAIMLAIIFIGSIQLFCIGIICMYLSSIYEEGKKRPNYIVESTYGYVSDKPAELKESPIKQSQDNI